MIDPVFNEHFSSRRRWKHVAFLSLKVWVVPLLRALIRFKVYGLENIPKRGGAIVVGNHIHNSDPILMLAATSRPILWMAKAEVWKYPGIRWFANVSGAFPVDRGTFDRDAIRTAIDILNDGLLLGIYPEGTRSTTGGLSEPFAGASLVAIRTNAPIIPCVIVGSDDLPLNGKKQRARRHRYPQVQVLFGNPFRLERNDPEGKRYKLDELTDAIMIELARLLPERMRGIYTDCAGRSHPAVRYDHIQFLGAGK